MPDEIRQLSAQLAQDPGSLVFLRLGELLRRKGQLDHGLRVAIAGLERHPHNADAHDLYARLLADKHDFERAFDEWDMALRIAPNHTGALKGLAFLYFKIGDIAQAVAHLEEAQRVLPGDPSITQALALVQGAVEPAAAAAVEMPASPAEEAPKTLRPPPPPRPPAPPQDRATRAPEVPLPRGERGPGGEDQPPELVPPPPRATAPVPEPAPIAAPGAGAPLERERVFAGLEGAQEGLLLLDGSGRVLGGAVRDTNGSDVTDAVAAYLAGVSQEATRTGKLLTLGAWTGLSAEGQGGHVHLSQLRQDALLLVVRDRSVPLGRLAVLAERAAQHARSWLEEQG